MAARGHRARGVVPDEREHRPVVVGVGVDVEQVGAGGVRERSRAPPASRPSLTLTTHSSTREAVAPAVRRDADVEGPAGTVQAMAGLGTGELLIVLVVVLVLFGGSKLPKLARSLGQAQNEFKQGIKDGSEDDDDAAPRRRRGLTPL